MDIIISIINENKKELNIRPNLTDLYSPSTIPSSIDPHGYLSKKQSIQYDYIFKHTLPFNKFQFYIELSWLLSNGVGIFLFLLQVAFVCYIKFSPMSNATTVYLSGWIIITIILVIFILFSYRFYILLIEYKMYDKKNDFEHLGYDLKNLANMSIQKKKFNILNGKNLNDLFVDEKKRVNSDLKTNNTKYSSISLNDLKASIYLNHDLLEIDTKKHLNFYGNNPEPKQKTLRTNSIS